MSVIFREEQTPSYCCKMHIREFKDMEHRSNVIIFDEYCNVKSRQVLEMYCDKKLRLQNGKF